MLLEDVLQAVTEQKRFAREQLPLDKGRVLLHKLGNRQGHVLQSAEEEFVYAVLLKADGKDIIKKSSSRKGRQEPCCLGKSGGSLLLWL